MATSSVVLEPQRQVEDILLHLPCSRVVEYRKGQLIYSPDQPFPNIFLVLGGKVKVWRASPNGYQVVVDIYHCEELFGESAMLREPPRGEHASAMEATRLMTWTTSEIEDLLMKRPRLAVAMVHILTRRTIDFANRIEGFSATKTAHRLAHSLLRFSERLGTPEDDGGIGMPPLTHEFLAQYVGTSREIVTQHMNQLRRRACLRYSRKRITVYRQALNEWLTGTADP
jgi:CRP/FNR family transcriptional regulator, cyclic AMP receptor protein